MTFSAHRNNRIFLILTLLNRCLDDFSASRFEQPIFSYIRFEPSTKKIVDIREKVAISRYANTGAYGFPCGEKLRDACCGVLDNPVGKAGEFYTSTIIEKMIRDGKQVSFVRCDRSVRYVSCSMFALLCVVNIESRGVTYTRCTCVALHSCASRPLVNAIGLQQASLHVSLRTRP